MYPNLNVNGVGGTNNSGRPGDVTQRAEQDPRDINVFGNTQSDDIDMSDNLYIRKMNNAKRAAEDSSQKTQSHMDRVKHYINQGYSYAQAIEAVEQEEGGAANRGQLVQRLVDQGYDRETAEKVIPKNIDKRLDDAREKGRAEGERRIQELDEKLENIKRKK